MHILIIEDAERMARTLRLGLGEEGFASEIASDGVSGLRLAASGDFDLVLLDVMLPGLDGMEVMRALRAKRSDVPVIMVTARDRVEDRVAGLNAGADDYLTKPFSFAELLARIHATMRRPGSRARPVLEACGIALDPARGSASRGGRPLRLSAREFALLQAFLEAPGEVRTRARLYDAVWGTGYDGTSNVLDVYVTYLRRALEESGEPRVLHTVRGRGYLLGEAT
jgi:DNA-binding response OmpR family regulator